MSSRRRFFREIAGYARGFFNNWAESEAPLPAKLGQSLRNRWRGVVTGEFCCGNHGAPGC
jgi:hypothetical protein